MARKIHAVMQHSHDFDRLVSSHPVQDEMPRLFHSADFVGNASSAVIEVIGPHKGGDFRTAGASHAIGIHRYVSDRADQKRLISKAGPLAELLVRPGQN